MFDRESHLTFARSLIPVLAVAAPATALHAQGPGSLLYEYAGVVPHENLGAVACAVYIRCCLRPANDAHGRKICRRRVFRRLADTES